MSLPRRRRESLVDAVVHENLGGGVTFFRFDRATAGSRAGWVIVEQMTGDDARLRGHQRPGGSYRGLLAELVAAVAADPLAAAVRYGHERRICGVCGHQLTAAESRERGIGLVCGGRLVIATARNLDEEPAATRDRGHQSDSRTDSSCLSPG